MQAATSSRSHFDVPGPRAVPLIGRKLNILKFAKDAIGHSRSLFAEYGNLVSLVEGGGTRLYSSRPTCPGTVFACGPELTRQVTTQQDIYHKCPLSGPLYRFRNDSERTKPLRHFLVGIFGDNGDRHLQQRRLMAPAFHKQRLQTYVQDMVRITDEELNKLPVGQVQNMSETMRLVTLRIAAKSLFGEELGSQGGNSIGAIIQEALTLQTNLSIQLLRYDLPGFAWHGYLNAAARYEQSIRALIDAKRQRGGDESDVLSMLMQVQDEETQTGLTEEELLGHVGGIFVAGHETSANALTWTLLLLSQHPQIAADVLDELEGLLQGGAPTLETLQQLPLLERVIKESMRILSPVSWNGRVTAQPTELGGYSLPEGTEVFVSISQTHHMGDLYPDPESFNPSRWETITPTAYEYNPFSAGPRICIGAGFAMMEIKIVLAMLLQRYRLEFVPENPIDRAGVIIMRPKHGMSMKVHPQDHQFQAGVGTVQGNIREMVHLPG